MSWNILIPDFGLSPFELEVKYEKHGQHPHHEFYPMFWREDVANGNTMEGYWTWVREKLADIQYELERDSPYA